MTAEALEIAAKEARRRADIAKHVPLSLDILDNYGDEQSRRSCEKQIDLMNLAGQLQNAYAAELQNLWAAIKTLRAEALYWRQKYHDANPANAAPTTKGQ